VLRMRSMAFWLDSPRSLICFVMPSSCACCAFATASHVFAIDSMLALRLRATSSRSSREALPASSRPERSSSRISPAAFRDPLHTLMRTTTIKMVIMDSSIVSIMVCSRLHGMRGLNRPRPLPQMVLPEPRAHKAGSTAAFRSGSPGRDGPTCREKAPAALRFPVLLHRAR
jgi:hypothetical protein